MLADAHVARIQYNVYGRTQILFLRTHGHTVLRRTCTRRGLRYNMPVKYTIVRTYARI